MWIVLPLLTIITKCMKFTRFFASCSIFRTGVVFLVLVLHDEVLYQVASTSTWLNFLQHKLNLKGNLLHKSIRKEELTLSPTTIPTKCATHFTYGFILLYKELGQYSLSLMNSSHLPTIALIKSSRYNILILNIL